MNQGTRLVYYNVVWNREPDWYIITLYETGNQTGILLRYMYHKLVHMLTMESFFKSQTVASFLYYYYICILTLQEIKKNNPTSFCKNPTSIRWNYIQFLIKTNWLLICAKKTLKKQDEKVSYSCISHIHCLPVTTLSYSRTLKLLHCSVFYCWSLINIPLLWYHTTNRSKSSCYRQGSSLLTLMNISQ